MKKVYVMPVSQHQTTFYMGKYDPRKLVLMADQSIEIGQVQEAQRPLEKKHLQEIAEYTGTDKGLLPASVMISSRDKNKLKLEVEVDAAQEKKYFIQFPETPGELKEYEGSIDIIDGQHRLFAFCDKYRSEDLKDSTTYEMGFSMFITPDLKMRQRLFTITNEKQKAVSGNLLLYLKSKLEMLNSAEKKYLPLVQRLNAENQSPLKGRIIMSAERIPKGYKAKELIKILDKGKVGELTMGNPPVEISQDQLLKAISVYLSGWEEHYGLSYRDPKKETMTKISGLRYILLLFTTFADHAINSKQEFTEAFVKEVIEDLEEILGVAEGEKTLFDNTLEFRGEGATVKRAMDDAAQLKAYLAGKLTSGFNPFA